MLGRRALSSGRLAALGATPDLHHGLLVLTRQRLLTKDEDPRKNEMHAGLDFLIFVCVVTS
jgi:hypothetical protein